MKVSIIIPNYNGAQLLDSCIESLYLQTYSDFDITVVDNGSTDKSYEILSKYKHKFWTIYLSDNVGFSRAVNKGINATDGDIILVLNNDTILHPDCLSQIVSGMNTFPSYGFYAPRICEMVNPTKVYAAGLMFSDKGYGNRSQRYQLQSVNYPIELFGACGAAAIYRREVLKDVGVFNENYFFLYEDLELSFRHQLLGYRCLYLPSAIIYHEGSATLRRFFPLAVKEAVKNSFITLLTCTPTAFIKRYSHKIIWFYFTFWYHVLRKGYLRAWLSAVLYVVANFAEILKRRKALQSTSALPPNYIDTLIYRGEIYINFPDEVIKI